MSNDDSVGRSPRLPDAGFLRVVPTDRTPVVRGRGQGARGGVPRTAEEWTALVKVGSGETDIPPEQCRQLRTMGLVLTVSGTPALTRHGRFTLGLPD